MYQLWLVNRAYAISFLLCHSTIEVLLPITLLFPCWDEEHAVTRFYLTVRLKILLVFVCYARLCFQSQMLRKPDISEEIIAVGKWQ